MRHFAFATLACVVFGVGHLSGQEVTSDHVMVKDIVAVLSAGTLSNRQIMMSKVVMVRASAKSPAVAASVAAELRRVTDIIRARQNRMASGLANASAPDLGEYLGLLVEACSQSSDPVVIPALVGAMNTGDMAADALTRFGGQAVDAVIGFLLIEKEPSEVSGGLRVLTKMLASAKVSSGQRISILRIAREKLIGPQHPIVLAAAMHLCVATGDIALRGRVAALASGAERPKVVRSDYEVWVRAAARRALGNAPGK